MEWFYFPKDGMVWIFSNFFLSRVNMHPDVFTVRFTLTPNFQKSFENVATFSISIPNLRHSNMSLLVNFKTDKIYEFPHSKRFRDSLKITEWQLDCNNLFTRVQLFSSVKLYFWLEKANNDIFFDRIWKSVILLSRKCSLFPKILCVRNFQTVAKLFKVEASLFVTSHHHAHCSKFLSQIVKSLQYYLSIFNGKFCHLTHWEFYSNQNRIPRISKEK